MDFLNNLIWKCIFQLFEPVTDNVWLVIVLSAFVASGIMLFVRWKLKKCTYVFLLPEWIMTISVGYMIHRLPIVHDRLNLALSTVSGIILQSSTYQKSFQEVTGLTELTKEKIASNLYFSEDAILLDPTVMYEHLFQTLDQIRKAPVLGQVHEECFGSPTPIFIGCIAFIFLAGILTIFKSGTRFRFWIFALQTIFLISCTAIYNGAAFCALILWASELLISEVFSRELFNNS